MEETKARYIERRAHKKFPSFLNGRARSEKRFYCAAELKKAEEWREARRIFDPYLSDCLNCEQLSGKKEFFYAELQYFFFLCFFGISYAAYLRSQFWSLLSKMFYTSSLPIFRALSATLSLQRGGKNKSGRAAEGENKAREGRESLFVE